MTGATLETYQRGGELGAAINTAHAQVVTSATNMVIRAVECGNLLIEAKERIPHGSWVEWLDENFDGSGWVARKYMALARAEAAERGSVTSSGTIRAALKSIATPRDQIEPAKPDPNSATGMLLSSARGALRGSDEIVDAEVVEGAPSGIEERRWTAALRRHEELRRAMNEAVNPTLTSSASAQALKEASIEARRFAVDLEQMAEARRRN